MKPLEVSFQYAEYELVVEGAEETARREKCRPQDETRNEDDEVIL